MNRPDPDDSDERPRWHDPDDDDESRSVRFEEIEVEPEEEEKEDRHPVLGGTVPVARFVFLCLVLLVVLAGAVALIRGLGARFFP